MMLTAKGVQFQVRVELFVSVKLTALLIPPPATLPLPFQPVQTTSAPLVLTNEGTLTVRLVPSGNQYTPYGKGVGTPYDAGFPATSKR